MAKTGKVPTTQLFRGSGKLLRQPGALDVFAAIYTDDVMTAGEFLGSIVRLARDRLEGAGMDEAAAHDQVILELALDFPALIVKALIDYDDDHESEDFLGAVLARTQATLANGGRNRPRRLDA